MSVFAKTDRAILVWLYLALLGWYLVTAGGHTYSSDEETMIATSFQLSRGAGLHIPADVEQDIVLSLVRGQQGKKFGKYPIGPSLVVLPWVYAGRALAAGFAPRYWNYIFHLVVSTCDQFITPLAALVFYLLARQLNCPPRRALLLALLLGLASPLFPYAQTFFSENLVALLTVTAAWLVCRRNGRRTLLAGTIMALSPLMKYAAVLFYLPLLLYVWLYGRDRPYWVRLKNTAIFCLPLLLSIMIIGGMNYARFGHPLQTGYHAMSDFKFSDVPQVGLWGLTISPGKGLLWYWPVIVLAGLALPRTWRKARPEFWLAVSTFLINLGFYSWWFTWAGENSWGPRYLVPSVALLSLPLVFWKPSRRARRAGVIIVTLSLLVQFLGTAIYFNSYYWQAYHGMTEDDVPEAYRTMGPYYKHDLHATIARSPLVGHARLLAVRSWDTFLVLTGQRSHLLIDPGDEIWLRFQQPATLTANEYTYAAPSKLTALYSWFWLPVPDFAWCYLPLSGLPDGLAYSYLFPLGLLLFAAWKVWQWYCAHGDVDAAWEKR